MEVALRVRAGSRARSRPGAHRLYLFSQYLANDSLSNEHAPNAISSRMLGIRR
jgi:hypothetical protein